MDSRDHHAVESSPIAAVLRFLPAGVDYDDTDESVTNRCTILFIPVWCYGIYMSPNEAAGREQTGCCHHTVRIPGNNGLIFVFHPAVPGVRKINFIVYDR